MFFGAVARRVLALAPDFDGGALKFEFVCSLDGLK
jgi:hypothetical protein